MVAVDEVADLVGDDVIAATPHLAVRRASRLLQAGNQEAGLRWLSAWIRAPGAKPWAERIQAGRGLAALGHRYLDGLATLWSKEQWGMLDDDEATPALKEALAQLAARALTADERTVRATDNLFEQASALLSAPSTGPAALVRLSVPLPLAMRVDWHGGQPDEDGSFELTRSAPLYDELEERLKKHPRHPAAWVLLAAWQRFVDEDATLATQRAEHFGGQEILDELLAMLRTDGLLVQN